MAAGTRVSFFQWAKENLLASPGATVFSAERGKFNIPTLVPARRTDGACKFLDDDNRCTVHAASPFGCAYFDSHQSVEMGLRGSALGLNAVIQNSQPNGLYRRTWAMLHEAGLCALSPTECRERMKKALDREVKA